jgi:hypothetical protein
MSFTKISTSLLACIVGIARSLHLRSRAEGAGANRGEAFVCTTRAQDCLTAAK